MCSTYSLTLSRVRVFSMPNSSLSIVHLSGHVERIGMMAEEIGTLVDAVMHSLIHFVSVGIVIVDLVWYAEICCRGGNSSLISSSVVGTPLPVLVLAENLVSVSIGLFECAQNVLMKLFMLAVRRSSLLEGFCPPWCCDVAVEEKKGRCC